MSRPNLVFVMSDDHASHAISAYGSRLNHTPQLDRIANEGIRFDACFCTNSICTPSRAAVLTGTYNHVNGVTTLDTPMDNSLVTYPKLMQQAGYQTAIFGKWHLGHGPSHDPAGFDDWAVLPDQGLYHDPDFLTPAGRIVVDGYATDIITDMSLDWLERRDPERPFALMIHHKAPHRPWEPDDVHASMYEDERIPEPDTFWDDYETRATAARVAEMRMMDLNESDLKEPVPVGLSHTEEVSWRYQRYIKDYLRVVASIDDNVGRVLDWLDEEGLADDTVVVYTSDQGFFLGDHGWFDKRFMYEESLSMPLLIRYPPLTEPGSVCSEMVLNVDFASTFLELAGIDIPSHVQGASFARLLRGEVPDDWQQAMYYRYWMHQDRDHNVWAHYGVRTHRHKLICYYNDPLGQPGARGPSAPPEWELFDLESDPFEMRNIIDDPDQAETAQGLRLLLRRLQDACGDQPIPGG